MKILNIIKSTIIVLFVVIAFTFIFNITLHFIQKGYEKDAIIRIPYISGIIHQDNYDSFSKTDYACEQDSTLNQNNEYYHKPFYKFNNEINYDSILNLFQSRINLANWFIAFIGAILTFLAFYVQYRFNRRQKEDLEKERFENKLFHLLDVYRDICSKTSIPKVGSDKTAFHYMFYEYKAIFRILKNDASIGDKDMETLNYIAFTYFINGTNLNRIELPIINRILDDKTEKRLREKLLKLQQKSEKPISGKKHRGIKYLMDYKDKGIKHFDGHRPRFIPYIKYILLITEFIGESLKEKDMKFLISEQTDHEIGLIYAYCGYCKYLEEKEKKHTELSNIFNSNAALFKQMFNSLPNHMKHKFIYNSKNPDFFS